MPKVSVVIPVYNVEPYIERCLHSLFSQTLSDMEYIFVDDASPDLSYDLIVKVLEEYPHRVDQTKIIRHTSNKGVAAARTAGILAATGEYIIHCDPDDYAEPNMYERLYEKAVEENSDVVICDYWKVDLSGARSVLKFSFDGTPREYLHAGVATNFSYANLWNKLVRRSLIEKYDIIPFPGCDYSEDIGCVVRILYYADSMSHVNQPLYSYCLRTTSITAMDIDMDKFNKMVRIIEPLSAFLEDKGLGTLCNEYKFNVKMYSRKMYDGREEEWVALFKECHKDIFKYTSNAFKVRLMWWVALKDVRLYRFLRRTIKSLQ